MKSPWKQSLGANVKGTNYGMLWSLRKSEFYLGQIFKFAMNFVEYIYCALGVGARINIFS